MKEAERSRLLMELANLTLSESIDGLWQSFAQALSWKGLSSPDLTVC